MKKLILIAFLTINVLLAQAQIKRVLVFTKTARYHHESIPEGVKAIQKIAVEDKFMVDVTTDSTVFNENNLKRYAAVIFLNTSGNVLDTVQKTDFRRYIEAGGGYMGIHCASSTEKSWTWYGHLVGAVFTDHPEPQNGTIDVVDHQNPSTAQLSARWAWKDEWYNFRDIQPDLHVLFKADESTYKGGKNGANHPLAWYHEYDGGRAFYTALGHFNDAYVDPLFVKHIREGIKYAIGNNIKLDYSKAKVARFKN